MDAFRADIQKPDTNWLRTTARRAVAITALTAAIVGPTDKAGATGPTPTPKAGANTAKAQPSANCQWANIEGRRQFPTNTNPVTVRVDGSCDPDPSAPIGIYPSAKQAGQPLALVHTGDELTVQCYVSNGELIKDVRDSTTAGDQNIGSSSVWLKVQSPDGTVGKIPETWTGFPGIAVMASLGIRECQTQ